MASLESRLAGFDLDLVETELRHMDERLEAIENIETALGGRGRGDLSDALQQEFGNWIDAIRQRNRLDRMQPFLDAMAADRQATAV